MIGIDRLGEEVERAFLHRRDRVLDAAERGHHDDRQLGIELLGGAQHAEAVALGQPQVGQHDAGPRASAAPATASGWSRASMTVCPCASSAWRSIARSESLSSTSRIGGSAARGRELTAASRPGRRRGAPLPRGRRSPSCRPRSLFFSAVELGERLLPVAARSPARCAGSSRLTKSVVSALMRRLQRVGERLVAFELRLQLLHAAGPVGLVLRRLLVVSLSLAPSALPSPPRRLRQPSAAGSAADGGAGSRPAPGSRSLLV